MSLIVISREMGTGGTQLGRAAARRLGYRFADREMIMEAARRYQVGEDSLSRIEESKPSFWERFDRERQGYLVFLQAVLYAFAADDDAVIAGRAAPLFFRDVPHALRVRVTAPLAVRAARVAEESRISTADAEERVRRYDEESAARIASFFRTDGCSVLDYDLVVNSERGTVDGHAEVLAKAVEMEPFRSTPESVRALRELALATQVRAALLRVQGLDTLAIRVRAEDDVVYLEGAVFGERWAEAAENAARTVPGVARVVCKSAPPETMYVPPRI